MRAIKKQTLPVLSWKIIRAVLIIGISFIILYPLIVKLSLSFMAEQDLYDSTVTYIPKHFTFENFLGARKIMNYYEAVGNTFILSLVVAIFQAISCTLVGYGFARFKFRGKGIWFSIVILTLIVPPQIIMTPLFLQFRYFDILGIFETFTGSTINLIDTYWPFVLMSLGCMGLKNGLYIYLTRQFFRGMPKELEEAAYVDGAGIFKTFMLIMLPGAIPIMITCFMFSFVWQWTDIFYTSNFFQSKMVLASALSSLPAQISTYSRQMTGGEASPAYISMITNTGVLMTILPLLVIYLFTQKYFVESIQTSGIKM